VNISSLIGYSLAIPEATSLLNADYSQLLFNTANKSYNDNIQNAITD